MENWCERGFVLGMVKEIWVTTFSLSPPPVPFSGSFLSSCCYFQLPMKSPGELLKEIGAKISGMSPGFDGFEASLVLIACSLRGSQGLVHEITSNMTIPKRTTVSMLSFFNLMYFLHWIVLTTKVFGLMASLCSCKGYFLIGSWKTLYNWNCVPKLHHYKW